VVRRLASTSPRKFAVATIWTLALIALVFAADSALLGPEEAPGWIEADDVEHADRIAGVSIVPRYLPEGLTWPPPRILVRVIPERGLWYGVDNAGGRRVLWLGFGFGELPDEVERVIACADGQSTCLEPWHAVTAETSAGSVHIVSRLTVEETERLAGGLQLE